jgi:hypothetical protein
MQRFFPAQSQFAMLAIGAAIMATLLAATAIAASHWHLPHYPTDIPPLSTFLSPTNLARAAEAWLNGVRYRHWAMGAMTKWFDGLANLRAA